MDDRGVRSAPHTLGGEGIAKECSPRAPSARCMAIGALVEELEWPVGCRFTRTKFERAAVLTCAASAANPCSIPV